MPSRTGNAQTQMRMAQDNRMAELHTVNPSIIYGNNEHRIVISTDKRSLPHSVTIMANYVISYNKDDATWNILKDRRQDTDLLLGLVHQLVGYTMQEICDMLGSDLSDEDRMFIKLKSGLHI